MFRCEWCEQMLDECELADWCVEWLCEDCANADGYTAALAPLGAGYNDRPDA